MPETVPCRGCGGDRFETIYEDCGDLWFRIPGKFPVVRCSDCELVQTNPRPTATELEAFYPDDYSPEGFPTPDSPIGKSAPVRVLRWLAAVPYRARWGRGFVSGLKPGRVLDVGAGQGSRLARLAEEGWEPWLLEPRVEIAKQTAGRLGIPLDRVVMAYAEEADLPEGSFDLVVMDHTVEHLSDPRAVFDSMARGLRPGGRLLVTCPNFDSLESKFYGRRWFGLEVPRHLIHFGVRSLAALAGRSGLEAEDVRPQYGVLVAPSILFSRQGGSGPDRPLDSTPLGLPLRLTTFALELLVTVAQAFGYMPMMEVVFRKPVAVSRASAPAGLKAAE